VRGALALAGLFACGTYERVRDADGEVYECNLHGDTAEYCYFADSAAELADLTGSTACRLTDRWFPLITNAIGRGCRYVCPGQTGCNAHLGCWCPQ
jgi:hypothetical protein